MDAIWNFQELIKEIICLYTQLQIIKQYVCIAPKEKHVLCIFNKIFKHPPKIFWCIILSESVEENIHTFLHCHLQHIQVSHCHVRKGLWEHMNQGYLLMRYIAFQNLCVCMLLINIVLYYIMYWMCVFVCVCVRVCVIVSVE